MAAKKKSVRPRGRKREVPSSVFSIRMPFDVIGQMNAYLIAEGRARRGITRNKLIIAAVRHYLTQE